MSICTKTGDHGSTGLANGSRVSKSSQIIEAIGNIDELNCALGVLLAEKMTNEIEGWLVRVQEDLFKAGAILAKAETVDLDYEWLEEVIDLIEETVPKLEGFILPNAPRYNAAYPNGLPLATRSRAVGLAHLTRAVCRRAERSVIKQKNTVPIYLNRLSDFLFMIARVI